MILTKKRFDEYKKSLNITHLEIGHSSEKDIINKIINAKPNPRRQVFSKHMDVFYGSSASAIINPPSHFNLPRMIIQVGHFDKSSSFGGHDEVMISLWLDTGNDSVYVPAGQICDNPRVLAHRKKLYAGKPIEQEPSTCKQARYSNSSSREHSICWLDDAYTPFSPSKYLVTLLYSIRRIWRSQN